MSRLSVPRCRNLLIALALSTAVAWGMVTTATAATDTIAEFKLPASSGPANIVAGADGNLWFTDDGATPAIGRITPSGVITEYSTGLNPGSSPGEIVRGPDGNIWFTDDGSTPAIGRITPSGAITEFSGQLPQPTLPVSLVNGADGNLWFIDEANTGRVPAIGRITPSGDVTEFSNGLANESGGFSADGAPTSLAAGPDGNLWFTEVDTIGRITTGGAVTLFNDTPANTTFSNVPNEITSGPGGDLWFVNDYTSGSGAGTPGIGRVTTAGAITGYSAGLSGPPVGRLVSGPDGSLWFAEDANGSGGTSAIGRITPTGTVSEFRTGLGQHSVPDAITPGPDGNLYFSDLASAIGKITPGGAITEFTGGLNADSGPVGIVAGPDGNMWFTDPGFGASKTPAIGRLGLSGSVAPPLSGRVPKLTAVRQSHLVWREGNKLAAIARANAAVGTMFELTLNEAARVRFSFTYSKRGRKVHGRCVARTRKNDGKHGCTLTLVAGTLFFAGHSGLNRVSFYGRVSRTVRLSPRSYKLVIRAAVAGEPTAVKTLSFRIFK